MTHVYQHEVIGVAVSVTMHTMGDKILDSALSKVTSLQFGLRQY